MLLPFADECTNKLDEDYADDFIAMLEKMTDSSCVVPAVFVGLLDTRRIISSRAMLDMYSVDWGSCWAVAASASEHRTWGSQWLQVVSPRLPERLDGGVDMAIGLEEHQLERLGRDNVWTRFAARAQRARAQGWNHCRSDIWQGGSAALGGRAGVIGPHVETRAPPGGAAVVGSRTGKACDRRWGGPVHSNAPSQRCLQRNPYSRAAATLRASRRVPPDQDKSGVK